MYQCLRQRKYLKLITNVLPNHTRSSVTCKNFRFCEHRLGAQMAPAFSPKLSPLWSWTLMRARRGPSSPGALFLSSPLKCSSQSDLRLTRSAPAGLAHLSLSWWLSMYAFLVTWHPLYLWPCFPSLHSTYGHVTYEYVYLFAFCPLWLTCKFCDGKGFFPPCLLLLSPVSSVLSDIEWWMDLHPVFPKSSF